MTVDLNENVGSAPSLSKERDLSKDGTVLVVDDEKELLASLSRVLDRSGWKVIAKESPLLALSALEDESIDIVLTDVQMPNMNGVELCREVKKRRPDVEVVMMTAVGTIETAVEAMKAGAYDFLTKPFDHPDVVNLALIRVMEKKKLFKRNQYLESQVELSNRFENILGTSPKMKQVFRLIENVAPSDTTVLVVGESGTGKELVARAIHERSERKAKSFLAVNCSAFTETLLESELFGHAKGAFTGATNVRKGLFAEADQGTVFLDEIGDTAPSTQAKLLRVLQEGEFKPVGSNQVQKVDVRIISATNVDLPTAIKESRFREDLYYRINVLTIELPPLRERSEDIPLLVQHFIRKYARKSKKAVREISRDAMAILLSYRWAGNVRELENIIERAVILAQGEALQKEDFPADIVNISDPNLVETRSYDLPFAEAKRHTVASFEKQYLKDTLSRAGGVIAEAARLAHMDRSNFRRLMSRYKLEAASFRLDS